MKIAVLSEISARDKNPFILSALEKTGHEIINAGMTESGPGELTYIHTGLMAGIILNLGCADFVVGGCGTGEGFLLSAMQYPNVFCGHVIDPLEARLFGMINGGNCASLALNKGFGWAGDIYLDFIIEKLFSSEFGAGYPEHRKESQRISRETLKNISTASHKPLEEILRNIDSKITETVFSHKPFIKLISGECKNAGLKKFISERFLNG
jgi:Ribose 5-phosphate isomerase RpiB